MSDANSGAAAAALAGGGGDNAAAAGAQGAAAGGSPTPGATAAAAANDTWYSNAPPEYKGLVEKKGWKDAGEALKSYSELEKAFHASDKLMMPKDANDTAALDAVYNRLGRPESPDKYTFPEGVDAEAVKVLAPQLHKAGITQAQAEVLAGIDLARAQAQQQAYTEKAKADGDAGYKKLESEWGAKTAENIEFNRRALRAVGMTAEEAQSMMAAAAQVSPGASERFMRLLNYAGTHPNLREDPTGGLGGQSNGFGMTQNRAAMELENKGKQLREAAMKGDKAAKAELNRLYKASTGET